MKKILSLSLQVILTLLLILAVSFTLFVKGYNEDTSIPVQMEIAKNQEDLLILQQVKLEELAVQWSEALDFYVQDTGKNGGLANYEYLDLNEECPHLLLNQFKGSVAGIRDISQREVYLHILFTKLERSVKKIVVFNRLVKVYPPGTQKFQDLVTKLRLNDRLNDLDVEITATSEIGKNEASYFISAMNADQKNIKKLTCANLQSIWKRRRIIPD